jgi:hypothetical protein
VRIFLHRRLFELADPLGGHAVLIGEFLQRRLRLAEPASRQDIAAALVEVGNRRMQATLAVLLPVTRLDGGSGIRAEVLEVELRCLPPLVVVTAVRRRIKGDVAARQAAFHALYLADVDAEVVGNGPRLVRRQPGQAFLGAAQVEEQLALRLGRGDLDDTPVAQDELVDFRLYPVHREGHETHALGRVEALDRLHQADIALLDEVRLGEAVAAVAARDVHHEAQVGHDQFPRRLYVVLVRQAFGELPLALDAEYGNGTHRLHVGGKVGTGDHAIHGQQAATGTGDGRHGYRCRLGAACHISRRTSRCHDRFPVLADVDYQYCLRHVGGASLALLVLEC